MIIVFYKLVSHGVLKLKIKLYFTLESFRDIVQGDYDMFSINLVDEYEIAS